MELSKTAERQPPLWRWALTGVPAVTPGEWRQAGVIVRWLIAARASVFPLTGFSVVFAACLTVPSGLIEWGLLLASFIGLLAAHATNNLLNDLVDHRAGLDRDNYFRTRYGVQVLAAGLLRPAQFHRYLLATAAVALLFGLGISFYRGGQVWWFMLLGAFFVVFYTWPLKRMALGELAVWLTWGPLMVGGVCLVVSGALDARILLAGLVYGLGPTVVIVAKHTDKAPEDRNRGVVTLPSLMGDSAARMSILVLAVLQMVAALTMALFAGLVGMLAIGLAMPALWQLGRVSRQAPPAAIPPGYPEEAWPLWFTTHAFVYARAAGLWLCGGLLLQNLLGAGG